MSLDATEGPHHGHGLSDLTLNARWVFLKSRDETLRLAYIPSVIVPTGRRSNLDHLGPSQGYVSMGNLLAVTKDINRWTMSGNLGYEVPLASRGRTDSAAGTWTTGFAAGWHVLRWFQPEAEIIYEHDFESEGKGAKIVSAVLGAVIPVNSHLRFDLGVVQDVAGSGADQTTRGIFKVIFLT